jgi:formate dehydrogenase major subunit
MTARDQRGHVDHRLHRPVAERMQAHMRNMHVFDVKSLRAKGGKDGNRLRRRRLLRPAVAVLRHRRDEASRDRRCSTDTDAQDDGRRRLLPRQLRRQRRTASACWRRRLAPSDSEITTGFPEFDHVLLKKLGWWDELTDAEEKAAAEGKNWKTDLSGGIQRVCMVKHNGCTSVRQRQGARLVWNFPDRCRCTASRSTPARRTWSTSTRRTTTRRFWRLPTLFKTVQDRRTRTRSSSIR